MPSDRLGRSPRPSSAHSSFARAESTLFPNSIILALFSRVRFRQNRGPAVDDGLPAAGTLEIPLPNGRQKKPAWIVDGQQRAVALSKCNNPNMIIPINAFVADEVELQRDQCALMKRLTCCWHFCCALEFLSVFSCLCSTAGRDRPNGFRRQGGSSQHSGLRNF
jgi:hypothetical protein